MREQHVRTPQAAPITGIMKSAPCDFATDIAIKEKPIIKQSFISADTTLRSTIYLEKEGRFCHDETATFDGSEGCLAVAQRRKQGWWPVTSPDSDHPGGSSDPPAIKSNYLSAASLILAASLSSCAAPTVLSTPNSCATLLPSEWKQGVAGAELPTGDTVGDWIAFGDAQTGKLDQANGRTRDAIGIIERCEERDKQAVAKATRRWWQIF